MRRRVSLPACSTVISSFLPKTTVTRGLVPAVVEISPSVSDRTPTLRTPVGRSNCDSRRWLGPHPSNRLTPISRIMFGIVFIKHRDACLVQNEQHQRPEP